jgi:hypothetical protein
MGVLAIEMTLGISIVVAIPKLVLVQDENPALAYRIGYLEDPFGNIVVECTRLEETQRLQEKLPLFEFLLRNVYFGSNGTKEASLEASQSMNGPHPQPASPISTLPLESSLDRANIVVSQTSNWKPTRVLVATMTATRTQIS